MSVLRLVWAGREEKEHYRRAEQKNKQQVVRVDGVHLQPCFEDEARGVHWGACDKGGHGKFPAEGMLAPPPLPSHLISGQISGIQSGDEERRGPLGVREQGQLVDK